jgi:acetyl-CoA C-acetyltransferase
MSHPYIIGGYQSDFSRNFSKENKSAISLLRELIFESLNTTKLSMKEISFLEKKGKIGVFIGNFISELYLDQSHLCGLISEVCDCFFGVPVVRNEAACASGSAAFDAACDKIKTEEFDVCIVVGYEIMKYVSSKRCGDILGYAANVTKEAKGVEFPFPTLFGKLAIETVKKYNLDEKEYFSDLAWISNNNYCNAKRNPNAQTSKWFMSYKHANRRNTKFNILVGGGPLATTDCSQVTDGGACVVLCNEASLGKYAISKSVKVLSIGHKNAPFTFADKIKDSSNSEYVLKWTKAACDEAYSKALLKPSDIDIFELHDCFTSSEYAFLSCLGLCNPRETHNLIRDRKIAFDGKQPVNPSGGLIGAGHPVGASGIRMILDVYKQLAHLAGNYQIQNNPKRGMVLNVGGSATTNYAIILSI